MILKCVRTNNLNNSISYISGPKDMLESMQSILEKDLVISKEKLKVEDFTGY